MTGQTLGHYQILEKLGAGGMGEVYKARDTRLNRLVAIKVLPPDKVANPDRKRRFIQEAQAASALNHPNIVVIHDINEENGVDYMVMEYIAGKTLDAVIPRQGMRLGEALKAAIPIADGLAKAHSAGILHRDVKPSNIMIADDGRVKILDFGLAKLTETNTGDENATRTERPETEDGAILGTISYMSPEQAEAKKLDGRSDIFSFGAVLYEMVTGRKAFQGESRVSTLSAILKDDPKPPENIPADLDKIIRRCLRKDPARRFQGIADVKVELEEVREDSESGKLPSAAGTPVRPGARWLLPAAAAVVILCGVVYWLTRTPAAAPKDSVITQLTRDPGLTGQPALSPDGKLLAYASDRSGEGHMDIWVQQMAGGQPVRLTKGPGNKELPSFSSDGTKVVFTNFGDMTTSVVPALGGDPMILARTLYFGAAYSPDGVHLAVRGGGFTGVESPILLLPSTGGSPRKVETGFPFPRFLSWSPDGRTMLVQEVDDTSATGTGQEIYAIPAEGGKAASTGLAEVFRQRGLPSRARNVRWLTGRLIAAGSVGDVGVIDEFRLQKDTWRLDGTPRRLLALPGAEIVVAATDTGPIVFSSETRNSDIWSIPIDANSGKVLGEPENLTKDAAHDYEPSLSSDGKRMVFVSDRSGRNEVWLRDLTTGKDTQLTATPEEEFRARISPDGLRIAYEVRGKQGYTLAREIEGHEPLTVCRDCSGPRWTPDSGEVTYYTGNPIRYLRLNLRSGERSEIVSHPKYQFQNVVFSPDGRWISFHLPVSGGLSRIFIAPVKDGRAAPEGEWIPITDGKTREYLAWWSPNGHLLYFLHPSGGDSEIVAQPLDPVTKHPKGALIHVYQPKAGLRYLGAGVVGFSLAANRLVLAMSESKGNLWRLEQK